MSKFNKILLATVFAASAPAAFATCTSGCGTTPTGTNQTTTVGVNPTQITNANLQGGNNTATLTANPTANNTAVLTANPTANNTAVLTANPTANNTAVLNSNPTLIANPNATAVANGGQGGSSDVKVGVGVENTNVLSTGASTATVGNVAATGGDSKATVGNVSTGPSTSSATVQQGAVANNINYSTTYKAAASTAVAGSVIGSGHGCFEHKGGVGIGVQALTFGVSGNVNQGENYNKECANDQVDLAIISKGGDPVSNTLAAETAAARSGNVRAAIGAIPTSPLLGLYAQFQPVAAQAPAAAAPIIVKVEPTVITNGKMECPADKPFNPKTGKCGGDLAPR